MRMDGGRGGLPTSAMATRTFAQSLLILVTTVAVAFTAPQQSKGDGVAGSGCRPISLATNATVEAECRPDPSGSYYEGDCWALLLTRGPCPPMHWLVLDEDAGRGVCKLKVCLDHEALVGKQCERLGEASSSKHCALTQQLVLTESGEPQCECPLGMAYYDSDERCYHPYEQGPCQQGHALQVVFSGHKAAAECVASVCSSGEVALTQECEEATTTTRSDEYRCYNLSSPGPCKEGFLAIDPLLNRVTCIGNVPYDIFTIPRFSSCIPGSRRDRLGTCRMRFQLGR